MSAGFLPIPVDTTLFHVTHWKAGSQWFRAVLDDLCQPAIVPPENFESQLLSRPIAAGKIYPCAYLGKAEFDSLLMPGRCRRVVVIRDLRDTLTSGYFSIRFSHKIDSPLIEKWRNVLSRLNEEEGILYLLELWLPLCAYIQRGWLEAGEPIFRLESCMVDPAGTLAQIFEDGWGLPLDRQRLENVAARYSFEKLSGGRERGKEDAQSHYRKGVHGDWQNHFTPAIIRRFKAVFGDLLILAGYEKDMNW